jgi:hypothetical protein
MEVQYHIELPFLNLHFTVNKSTFSLFLPITSYAHSVLNSVVVLSFRITVVESKQCVEPSI